MNTRTFKFSHMLIAFFLIGTISCDMSGIEEPILSQDSGGNDESTLVDEAGANLRIGGNLIYHETFEGNNPFGSAHGLETGARHSVTYVTKPQDPNNKAARFELRDNDPDVKRSRRAEVTIVKGEDGHIGKDTWYAFDLFVPTDFKDEDDRDVINQWHQDGVASTALTIKNGKFLWRVYINGNRQDYDLGTIKKGQWNNFVIHMVHSYGSDGITEIWLNDKKLLDQKGRNINNDPLPKWKIGIYKSSWYDERTTVRSRVLYYDNVKVGDKNASYEEMRGETSSSNGGTVENRPTPTPEPTPEVTKPETNRPGVSNPGTDDFGKPSASGIEKLTFINAEYETDIYPLTDGATLSLSEQNTFKINVRADISTTVGSVHFELSGTKKYSYADNVKPYALFGDDSRGNYYYGPGMSPGKYTLKITTYTGAKGRGTVIGSETVDFTITR